MWFAVPIVLCCFCNQPFIKLDVVTETQLGKKKGEKKEKEKKKPQDKGSFLKNHEAGVVIMTF